MYVNSFDRYERRDSLIHGLDPRVKVVVTLLFILSNVLLPDGAWLAFLAAWVLLLWTSRLARLTAGYTIRRSFIALPFALAAVTVIFTMPGQPVATLAIGAQRIVISDAGVIRFASIVVRSWLSVQMAILLTATTAFPDLLHALRHLRLPRLLIGIISFMYRYLFVLVEEAARLLRAREARSARPAGGGGGGSLWWRAKVAGSMVGQLFVRSLDRSERVYSAMLARGYSGRLLTMNPHVMARRDWLAGVVAFVFIGLVQVLGRLPGWVGTI